MKKTTALFLALLLAAAALAGCGGGGTSSAPGAGPSSQPGQSPGAEKLRVVTTIFPQYDFVREVAGEAVELTMLLPPGAESHSFEPTPQDILTIQNCDLFIHVGGASDAWIEKILGSMDTGGITVLALMEMVQAKPEETVEGMQEDHEHEEAERHAHGEAESHEHEQVELDEHVWTSPKNAMAIAQAISDALCGLDAANAALYRQNTAAYLAKLAQLDADFEAAVAGGARHTLVFGDRFPFRYFADDYGLDYYAAFPGCASQTEPSAATIAFLIDKVKNERIPVVFYIEQSSQKMADTICADTGAKKLLFHSCHTVTQGEMAAGASYLSLMAQNVQALKEALA